MGRARVLMGVEVNGWRNDLQGTTVTSGNASFVVYAYPNFTFGSLGNLRPRAGVFLPGVQQTLLQLALGVTFH